ncbi:hypothetical protein [Mucilaginibacter sp.]|jgi:hypothetical protein|uniref:hypothetical protein n=1 Tax=Mucilaginibacter sp. TaxID=1882438 RepID=UPI002C39E569|nr:hypothetical protein [Mucilaginibacter sp.]HTI58261.1 hypothetical protein [Mucilaginibacter sp.]
MILVPRLTADALTLNAYSYQDREINIVTAYLSQENFQFTSNSIPKDGDDRKGIEFTMLGLTQILRLEMLLELKFQNKSDNKTSISFIQGNGGSNPYCCIRLKHMPWEKGCKDITAPDDNAAFIKCSLLASEENWFGADSKAGTCKGKV